MGSPSLSMKMVASQIHSTQSVSTVLYLPETFFPSREFRENTISAPNTSVRLNRPRGEGSRGRENGHQPEKIPSLLICPQFYKDNTTLLESCL